MPSKDGTTWTSISGHVYFRSPSLSVTVFVSLLVCIPHHCLWECSFYRCHDVDDVRHDVDDICRDVAGVCHDVDGVCHDVDDVFHNVADVCHDVNDVCRAAYERHL